VEHSVLIFVKLEIIEIGKNQWKEKMKEKAKEVKKN